VIDIRHLTEDEAQLHLEGGIPDADRTRVETHLEGCAECQALVISFEALSEALSALPLAEPPAGFTVGVMARIEEREAARASERRVAVGVLGVVLASLAVAVAFAGQAAWAPVVSAASSAGVRALQAFRITSDVVSPVVSALRIPILVAAAAVGIPLTLALSRLATPRHGQVA
jgi:anti-sigma factor RsiW